MNILKKLKTKISPGNVSENESVVKLSLDATPTPLIVKKRETWHWSIECIFSLIGYNLNLISVWNFPALCMKYGGVAFMIICLIMALFVGVPLYYVEISIGQMTGGGAVNVWNVAPLFKGIGWASLFTTFLVSIYYSVYVAWSVYYLAASFTRRLPWAECFPQALWGSNKCSTLPPNVTNEAYLYGLLRTVSPNGNTVTVDSTVEYPYFWRLPADEYFHNQVLKLTKEFSGVNNELHYHLVLCLLLGILICVLILSIGAKSIGKVMLILVILPYCCLLAVFVRCLTTDGVGIGLRQFVYPQWKMLQNYRVWGEAGLVTFTMLFVSWGNVSTMASYNRKSYSKCAETYIAVSVSLVNAVLIGLVVSSVIGVLAYEMKTNIETLIVLGPNLLYVTVAQGLTYLKTSPLWSALLYLSIFCISLSTLLVLLETIVKSLTCICQKFERKRIHLILLVCICTFLLSLGLICKTGLFVIMIFDFYSAWWNVLFLAFLELCIVAMFCSQIFDCNFLKSLETKYQRIITYFKCAIRLDLIFGCGIVLLVKKFKALILYSWCKYVPLSYGQYKLPYWANVIGWIFTCFPLILIPIIAIFKIVRSEGGNLKEKICTLCKPNPNLNTDEEEATQTQHKVVESHEQTAFTLDQHYVEQVQYDPLRQERQESFMKIAATEFAIKPGKINRPTQMSKDVQVQTGEEDGKNKKHRKHRHKHRHRKHLSDSEEDKDARERKHRHRHRNKSEEPKAPHKLPPLSAEPTTSKVENGDNQSTVKMENNRNTDNTVKMENKQNNSDNTEAIKEDQQSTNVEESNKKIDANVHFE